MGLSPTSSHGGAGGIAPNGIVLSRLVALDSRLVASHKFLWNVAYDDTENYNVITSVPSALGLTIHIDGSSSSITALVEGTWVFDLAVSLPDDATVAGFVSIGKGLQTPRFGPGVPTVTDAPLTIGVEEVLHLPAGATTSAGVTTTVQATGNPWSVTPYMVVSRLA